MVNTLRLIAVQMQRLGVSEIELNHVAKSIDQAPRLATDSHLNEEEGE